MRSPIPAMRDVCRGVVLSASIGAHVAWWFTHVMQRANSVPFLFGMYTLGCRCASVDIVD
jgi:hypothetical protein